MSDREMYCDRIEIETAHDIMGESERLRNDYRLLKKDFENFKTILNQTTQNKKDIYDKNKLVEIAKDIRNFANSKISNDYLISLLDDIYSYIDTDWRYLYPKCYDVARHIFYKTNIDSSSYNYADTILQQIKKQSISLNETKQNIAELNFFNNSHILKKVSEAFNEYGEEEYLRWLANEIYDKCWLVYNIKNSPSIKNLQLQREHEDLILKLQNEYEERKKEYTHNSKSYFEKAYLYLYDKAEEEQKEIEEIKRRSAGRMNQYLLGAKEKTRIISQNAKDKTCSHASSD